jgi:hypothetical protein
MSWAADALIVSHQRGTGSHSYLMLVAGNDQESRSAMVSSGLAFLQMAGIAPSLERRKVA